MSSSSSSSAAPGRLFFLGSWVLLLALCGRWYVQFPASAPGLVLHSGHVPGCVSADEESQGSTGPGCSSRIISVAAAAYMDEVFHVPQAQELCRAVFNTHKSLSTGITRGSTLANIFLRDYFLNQ